MSQSKPPYVLGLDVSTTCTGWALISLDPLVAPRLFFGKIMPPPSTSKRRVSWYERADFIYSHLPQALGDIAVCAICLEELNSFRGGEVTRQLAGINMGVRFLMWKKYGVEPTAMDTTTIKKAFTGSGKAEKQHMVAAANKIYGLQLRYPTTESQQRNKEINDEDQADAIACAHVFIKESGEELREALNKPKTNKVEGVYLGG